MTKQEREWNEKAADLLEGKTISKVEYMSKEEASERGFSFRPVKLVLDDGTILVPQSDDEGNDGGAVRIEREAHTKLPSWKDELLPVLR